MKNSDLFLTHVRIDRSALRHNLNVLKRLAAEDPISDLSRRKVFAGGLAAGDSLIVIKAGAYGHGMIEAARLIAKEKKVRIAVSDLQEGIVLRDSGIKGPILLLETSLPRQAPEIIRRQLTPTVCGEELADALNRAARRLKQPFPVHIKVDTGMRRQGVRLDGALEFIERMHGFRHLELAGLYTHFPSADIDSVLTRRQISAFHGLVQTLDQKDIRIPLLHAANSMGLAGYASGVFNLFRPGLMFYGLFPSAGFQKKFALKPALSVQSRIILIKAIQPGEGVSYGHTYMSSKPITAAIVPIGYNDGYSRALSNKACVLIGGRRCPVLGRVTMDQIIVDISRINDPKLGMEVVILGQQGRQEITADDLAAWAGTINYEIICHLGNRLPRVYF